MALIEQINHMRSQGFSDPQIIQSLREQGISPREILEAIDQSKIKTEVSSSDMTPSMMPTPSDDQSAYPMTQEISSYPSAQEAPQYPAYQEYPQYPQPYPQYSQQSHVDTETVSDLAGQIAEEKIDRVRKNIMNIEKISIENQSKLLSVDDRLKRVESIIDRLQTAILGKIGEYWKELSEIKSELHATQDTFSKVLHPMKKSREEHEKKTEEKQVKKSKPAKSFEHYLRR